MQTVDLVFAGYFILIFSLFTLLCYELRKNVIKQREAMYDEIYLKAATILNSSIIMIKDTNDNQLKKHSYVIGSDRDFFNFFSDYSSAKTIDIIVKISYKTGKDVKYLEIFNTLKYYRGIIRVHYVGTYLGSIGFTLLLMADVTTKHKDSWSEIDKCDIPYINDELNGNVLEIIKYRKGLTVYNKIKNLVDILHCRIVPYHSITELEKIGFNIGELCLNIKNLLK